MKRSLYQIIQITVFALTLTARAEVIEVQKMESLLPLITAKTLVVLDIDNTILAPTQTLGSDQWFGYLVEQNKHCGLSEEMAIDRAIIDWTRVQKLTKVRSVEASTPTILDNLQKARVPILGLTARPLDLAAATINQLRGLGIQAFNPGGAQWPLLAPMETIIKKGVIFVGPKLNKGTILKQFLIDNRLDYERIIFVDDKIKHVTNVEKALRDLNQEYFGLRYGAADAEVANFQSKIANYQWETFRNTGRILMDDQVPVNHTLDYDCVH